MSINKPNLFIVGAAKSGTTSLRDMLNQHPDVYMCPVKEPNYFSKDINFKNFRDDYKAATKFDVKKYLKNEILPEKHLAFINEENDYLNLFKNAKKEVYLGEASTSYLYSKVAAREIHNFNPDAKIIIILREPVERVISHYKMDVAQGRQIELDAYKAIKQDFNSDKKGWGISNLYVELSQYEKQVKRYTDIFDKSQVLILKFDELKDNPQHLLTKTFKFLEIDNFEIKQQSVSNPTLMPKNNFIKKLSAIYRKNVSKYISLPQSVKKMFLTKPEVVIKEQVIEFLEAKLSTDIHFYKNRIPHSK